MRSAGRTEPLIGLSGQEIPFSRLVHYDSDAQDSATIRLFESPWLQGAVAAGLPAPLTIIGDVATLAAARGGRPSHERVVTETLRIDVLGPCGSDLEMTGGAVWSGPRRVIATGVIRDRGSGEAVGHVMARAAVLDSRRPGSLVGRQGAPPLPDEDHAPSVALMLADAPVPVGTDGDVVQLRVPVTPTMGNSYGFMHGGCVGVICDVGLDGLRRHPAARLAGAHVQSVTLDYLAPVALDDAVVATARVVLRGAGKAQVVVSLGAVDDTVCAVATYTLRTGG